MEEYLDENIPLPLLKTGARVLVLECDNVETLNL